MLRLKGLLIQAITYAVAICVAVMAGRLYSDQHPLIIVAWCDLAATFTVFLCSRFFNNSSLYDPYWSVKPMVIAVYYFFIREEPVDVRSVLCGGLLLLYGLRLTSNFLRDWPGLKKEDWRYVDFRKQFPGWRYWLLSLGGIHLFPSVLVYWACIPAYYAIVESRAYINWLDGMGSLIFLGAIVLSFVADEQMRRFREKPENKGKVMDQGLWKYSRHPNYLGEVIGWWGLWLLALAVDINYYWTGIGALAITLLFYFISIPMMDRRSLERRPGFQRYMQETPALFPFYQRKARK